MLPLANREWKLVKGPVDSKRPMQDVRGIREICKLLSRQSGRGCIDREVVGLEAYLPFVLVNATCSDVNIIIIRFIPAVIGSLEVWIRVRSRLRLNKAVLPIGVVHCRYANTCAE